MYPNNTKSATNTTNLTSTESEPIINYDFEKTWPVTVRLNLETESGRALYRGIKAAIALGIPTAALVAMQYFSGDNTLDWTTLGSVGVPAVILQVLDKYRRDKKKG